MRRLSSCGSSWGRWGMSEWRALCEVADTNPESLSGATNRDYRFRYIDLSVVEHGRIEWNAIHETQFIDAPSRARRIVRSGDVLFGTVRPALQSHGCIDQHSQTDLIASTGFSVIRAIEGKADPRYLRHCVLSNTVLRQALNAAVGSNYPAVNDSDVQQFRIFAPALAEQSTIARILDTLDTQIEKTQALIAKLEQVKEGLLHDLLTRGVDENGELRPSAEEAPELYKESALGLIPTGWAISTLDSLALQVIDGTHFTPTYTESGVPFLRVTNLHGRDISSTSFKFVSADEHRILSQRCCPKRGDILLSKNGSVGIAREVTWDWEFSIFVSLALIRLTDNRMIRSDFMTEVLNSPVVQQQIFMRSKQGTVTNLHLEEIRDFLIPVPPSTEQTRILEHLQKFDTRYSAECVNLGKLKSLKSGLMDDLLSGRVRVTPLLDPQETAATA